jgi:hypothetical protein
MGAAAKDAIAQVPLLADAWFADAFDLVERVALGLAHEAAALDNDHLDRTAGEFARNRQPGRSTADDAKIRLGLEPRRKSPQVIDTNGVSPVRSAARVPDRSFCSLPGWSGAMRRNPIGSAVGSLGRAGGNATRLNAAE